eukprot:9253-Heterococcus_DN1.PRE.3
MSSNNFEAYQRMKLATHPNFTKTTALYHNREYYLHTASAQCRMHTSCSFFKTSATIWPVRYRVKTNGTLLECSHLLTVTAGHHYTTQATASESSYYHHYSYTTTVTKLLPPLLLPLLLRLLLLPRLSLLTSHYEGHHKQDRTLHGYYQDINLLTSSVSRVKHQRMKLNKCSSTSEDDSFEAMSHPYSVHLHTTECGHISIGQEDDHAEMTTCNSGGRHLALLTLLSHPHMNTIYTFNKQVL